jgi:CRP-like cAMP-binding protein
MIDDELHQVGAPRRELESAVAAHPFLAGINATHLRVIAKCAVRCQFRAGQVIFRKGDTANRFYLIERGKVALELSAGDQAIRIEEVGGGDLLGWSWIFPPFVWHFDARAIEPTTAIFFLRHTARILRGRPGSGLRTIQANERGDDASPTGGAGKIE